MFTNPHNQNLLNDVMRVLSGQTTETPIKPVPKWLSEAAEVAAESIKESEGVMTLEIRRDILRKHLSEAISNCDCEVTAQTSVQFDEEVRKKLDEKAPPSLGTKAIIPGKPVSTPSNNELETPAGASKKIFKPASKPMPKNVGLGSRQARIPLRMGESMEVVESELREFLTHLTEDEVTILRSIINETH